MPISHANFVHKNMIHQDLWQKDSNAVLFQTNVFLPTDLLKPDNPQKTGYVYFAGIVCNNKQS